MLDNNSIIEELVSTHVLSAEKLLQLITTADEDERTMLSVKARAETNRIFGKKVYLRGLLEVSNYCRNDCLYCGIRRSNKKILRYRMNYNSILESCVNAYKQGLRTFVLQGGEDCCLNIDKLMLLIREIKENCPNCAITLSFGELKFEIYQKLFIAGADRYLLRHETATRDHYEKLHPTEMDFDNRMRCLYDLYKIGYQVGCGFMVGSPYQTVEHVVKDLLFIKQFNPHMVGIGPFIPNKETPFKSFRQGTVSETVLYISLLRLLLPKVLLPATTALGSIDTSGREKGLSAGANVLMPNISPYSARSEYKIYENKLGSGNTEDNLQSSITAIRNVNLIPVVDKGDYPFDI